MKRDPDKRPSTVFSSVEFRRTKKLVRRDLESLVDDNERAMQEENGEEERMQQKQFGLDTSTMDPVPASSRPYEDYGEERPPDEETNVVDSFPEISEDENENEDRSQTRPKQISIDIEEPESQTGVQEPFSLLTGSPVGHVVVSFTSKIFNPLTVGFTNHRQI